jgi:tetratricopeptide (TPR) repeat protein
MSFRLERAPHSTSHLPIVVVTLALSVSLAPQLLSAASAPDQQNGDVTLTPNETLFAMLAAINSAGYDTGIGSETATGTRTEVRAWCAKRNPTVVPALMQFYHDHRLSDPAEDLGQYVSLALLLGPPPQFKFTIPFTDLPPDANSVRDIVPLLQRFYQQADLSELWIRMQPRYEAVIESLSDPVRRTLSLTDAFLRFPSGAYLGRNYAIEIALLGAAGAVQARIYGENYYLVLSPPTANSLNDIRHQYLHFLLDPLALKFAAEVREKQPLAALARPAPALSSDFKEDFSLLLTECLIRSVELRMDKPAHPEIQVNKLTQDGLMLVPYFYAALGDYIDQASSMSVYYQQMVHDISIPTERKRLAGVKFAAASTAAGELSHPVAPQSPEQSTLDQGDNLIFESKYAEAEAVFESVLVKNPNSERALFGLAAVASNTRKPDTAEKYYKKTLEVARSLRIVTWSHIYLGRLYDIEGRRDQALAEYRAALVTAAGFPDAERAAQNGQAVAYGSKP